MRSRLESPHKRLLRRVVRSSVRARPQAKEASKVRGTEARSLTMLAPERYPAEVHPENPEKLEEETEEAAVFIHQAGCRRAGIDVDSVEA